MKTFDLNGEYRLYTCDCRTGPTSPDQLPAAWIPAAVPGNVELDYMAAGLLPDVFYADNVKLAEALERKDFWYVRSFRLEELPAETAVLCFDGVDTVAEYFLNGILIGTSDNALIAHEFPVSDALRKGENTLAVRIRSVTEYAEQFDIKPYNVAFPGCYENLHVRKSAINFGWDISPRLLTAGIWKGVRLELREDTRIKDVYLATASVYDDVAVLVLNCNTAQSDSVLGKCSLQIHGECGDSVFDYVYPLPYLGTTVYPYVYAPKLWWPNGMGAQNLYDVSVRLLREDEVLAEKKLCFGIRTVELKYGEATDEDGDFAVFVNRKLCRCRGANHVPVSLLYSQSESKYEEIVRTFRDSNSNMIRVWGGGIYEGDRFFDLCDEQGILIWQDMMLSCHAYPMEQDFCDAMDRECEAVAMRLRNHPSLAFWCGGNETDWPYVCVGLNPNDDPISRRVIPNALKRSDPYRGYLPSTPYFSNEFFKKHGGRFYLDLEEIKNERTGLPEEHYWWHRNDFLAVREQRHKFISEIGYSGAAPRGSTEQYLPADWSFENDEDWKYHAWPTEGSRDAGYRYLFDSVPEDDNAKLLASQYYQAEAYKFVAELCRMRKENNGILIWTMRENWPSFSSAVVDYCGNRKPAFSVLQASYEPLQCMIDICNGKAKCFLVNDTGEAQSVNVRITDERGRELYRQEIAAEKDELVHLLAELPLAETKLFLTEIKTVAGKEIRNYRYVYTGKIFFPTYCALREKKLPGFAG